MKKIIVVLVIAVLAMFMSIAWIFLQKYLERYETGTLAYQIDTTSVKYHETLLQLNVTGDYFETEEALKQKGLENIFSDDKTSDTIFRKSTLLTREDCVIHNKYDVICPFTPKDGTGSSFSSYYRDGAELITVHDTEKMIGEKGVALNVYVNEEKIAELVGFINVVDGYVKDITKYKNNYVITYIGLNEASGESAIKSYYFDAEQRAQLGDHENRGTFIYKQKVGYLSDKRDQIYLKGQPITPLFDEITLYGCCAITPMPYLFNEEKGTLDFVAQRDHNLYAVHIDLIDQ